MKRVELIEWKIIPENLPDKDFRDRNVFSWNYLNETDNQQYAFLFYNVVEYAMGWYAGAFAILTNKNNPVSIFDSGEIHFRRTFESDFVYGEKSEIVQLVKHCKSKGSLYPEHTFCLVDFKRKLFSSISFDCSDFYCLSESGAGNFSIVLDKLDAFQRYEKREHRVLKNFGGKTIDSSLLIWTDTKYLKNYDDIYWRNKDSNRLG